MVSPISPWRTWKSWHEPSDSFGSQPFAGQVWPQNLGVKDDIQDDQSMCFGEISIEKCGKWNRCEIPMFFQWSQYFLFIKIIPTIVWYHPNIPWSISEIPWNPKKSVKNPPALAARVLYCWAFPTFWRGFRRGRTDLSDLPPVPQRDCGSPGFFQEEMAGKMEVKWMENGNLWGFHEDFMGFDRDFMGRKSGIGIL